MSEAVILEPESLGDFGRFLGVAFGPSEWLVVDQPMIDDFAANTRDHAWYHVDVERAQRELPGGATIAHGLLTLSLTPHLMSTILHIRDRSARALNYGYDRLRFITPVAAGDRIRLRGEVVGNDRQSNGVMIRIRITVEVEGAAKPAMVADWMELALI